MDIFNKQKIRDLEKQIFQLKVKEPPKAFSVSDIEKLKYEINYPRKYNIGDVKVKGFICTDVLIKTKHNIEYRACRDNVMHEQIIGRTYIFQKDNERLEIFEAIKGK